MINLRQDTTDAPARRSFFGRLAGAAALGLGGLVSGTVARATGCRRFRTVRTGLGN